MKSYDKTIPVAKTQYRLHNDYLPTSTEWNEISGPQGLQELANKGKIIVACRAQYGKHSNGLPRHGHVVMVLPGKEVFSDRWKEIVPVVIDTGEGRRWIGKDLGQSWLPANKNQVKYYLYKGTYKR